MGNCIRKEASEHWGGDDWGSFGSDRKIGNGCCGETSVVEESLKVRDSPTGLSAETEVKIRISKKQLEQLLGKGVPAEEIVARLVHIGGDAAEAHRRPWRPALGSIPE